MAPTAGPTGATAGTTATTTTTTSDHRTDPVAVAADALIVRPVGIAATAVGAAIFVVALPFAAIAGDVKHTGRILVKGPADFTFKRKLGDFEGIAP